MVIPAEEEEAGLKEKRSTILSLSRGSMPQSRLHNFSFPTQSWGNQRYLRCVNPSIRSKYEELLMARRCSSSSSPDEFLLAPPPPLSRVSGHKRGTKDDSNLSGPSASRPWNLRSRRSARNASAEIASDRNLSPSSSQSPSPSRSPPEKSEMGCPLILVARLEGFEAVEKGERREFSIALSREEIEHDFLAAKGTKPPRRPKKRAKFLQRQLDALFPGVLLSEITSDLYKIAITDIYEMYHYKETVCQVCFF